MPTEQLQSFSVPPILLQYFQDGIGLQQIITWLFYFVILYWAIYTTVAVYHWLTHSHDSLFAIPAIAVHIVVSLILIGYAVSGLIML